MGIRRLSSLSRYDYLWRGRAFIACIGRLYIRLDDMSRLLANAQRTAAATHRIFEILDRVPSVSEPEKPIHPGRVAGRIEIRDITFRYGTRQVIHNVNLTVEPGEMIGLVGPSGAGKVLSSTWFAVSMTSRAEPSWSMATTFVLTRSTSIAATSGSCSKSPFSFWFDCRQHRLWKTWSDT